ncbi:MAG: rod shape-determining protein MreD [Lachnospiraceae bacterium]|nr:rod shape-determining protein MreD [Lachnospiraceae bacterium]
MKRFITYTFLIIFCFLLQTTVFHRISFGGIVPNLLIVVTASLGFMRGDRTGLVVGLFCGLLIDIFFGDVIGLYAMIYMYLGYLNGKFSGIFYPEDLKLPLILILFSNLFYGLFTYLLLFMMRSRFNFEFYFKNVIFPEIIYTLLVALVLYPLILFFNYLLEGQRFKRTEEDV